MGREPSSCWDRPVTNAELDAVYGIELSGMAMEIGEQHILTDMELIAEFLIEGSSDREPCPYFGPIGTPELVHQILFNKNANDQQIGAAARELRSRVLKHFNEVVIRRATEVSHG
jgi:hypothetical protein